MDIYDVKESGMSIQKVIDIWKKDAILGIMDGLKERPNQTLDLNDYEDVYIHLGALSVSRFGIDKIIAFNADEDLNIEDNYERSIYRKSIKVVDKNGDTYYPAKMTITDIIAISNAIINANETDHMNEIGLFVKN